MKTRSLILTAVFLFLLFGTCCAKISYAPMKGVAARVDGYEISMPRFSRAIETSKKDLLKKTSDVSTEANAPEESGGKIDEREVKAAVLNQLIDGVLIDNGARREGIAVTEVQIEHEIAALKEKFPSPHEFHKSIAEQGMTIEGLKKNLGEQLKIKGLQRILMSKLVISDEEIQAFYDKNVELFVQPGKETTLSQAKDKIREFLLEEKGGDAFAKWLEDQKGMSDIVINDKLKYLFGTEQGSGSPQHQFSRDLT